MQYIQGNLEERLDQVSEQGRLETLRGITSGIISEVWNNGEKMPRYKSTKIHDKNEELPYRLATAIQHRYDKHSVNLLQDLKISNLRTYIKNSMNKKLLKRAYYGLLNFGWMEGESTTYPTEAISALTPLEIAYFLSGVWHEKSANKFIDKNNLSKRTPYGIFVPRIKEGINWLKEIHLRSRYKQPEGTILSYEDALLSLPETQNRIYTIKPKRTVPRVAPGQQLTLNFEQPIEQKPQPVKKPSCPDFNSPIFRTLAR